MLFFIYLFPKGLEISLSVLQVLKAKKQFSKSDFPIKYSKLFSFAGFIISLFLKFGLFYLC